MNKLRHIIWYEYRKQVFAKSFALILLSLPLVLVIILAFSVIANLTKYDYTAVGYVDQSGRLGDDPRLPPLRVDSGARQTVPIRAFPSEDEARLALEAGQIQAYYVIPTRYPADRHVELIYDQSPSDNAQAQFWDFLQINLLDDQPLDVARRAVAGSLLIARTPDNSRVIADSSEMGVFLPVFATFAFLIIFMISSGTLAEAVNKEKENRTIEVLITSISPNQLIIGKLIAITAMTVTQLLVWGGFTALAFYIGGHHLGIEVLRTITLSTRAVMTLVALLVPTYLLLAAIMIALGATLVESREVNAIGPLMLMLFEFPYILIGLFIENPNGTLPTILSLFPLSALQSITLRMAITTVPTWQIVASVATLTLTAVGAIWLAGRAFRLGMLRYGQRLRFRAIFDRHAVTALETGGKGK
jgi:ABC-2 type transport system permease protein